MGNECITLIAKDGRTEVTAEVGSLSGLVSTMIGSSREEDMEGNQEVHLFDVSIAAVEKVMEFASYYAVHHITPIERVSF